MKSNTEIYAFFTEWIVGTHALRIYCSLHAIVYEHLNMSKYVLSEYNEFFYYFFIML